MTKIKPATIEALRELQRALDGVSCLAIGPREEAWDAVVVRSANKNSPYSDFHGSAHRLKKLIDNYESPDPCEGKVVEIDGKKYRLTEV